MHNSRYIPKKAHVEDDMPQYEPFDPAPVSLTPRNSQTQSKNSVFHQIPTQVNDQMENLGRKNLSQDLEVVVLMMSVEIEKLKRQNQQQNNRMKDTNISQIDKDQISRLIDENLRYFFFIRLKQQLQAAQEQTEQWKYKYSQVDFSTQGKHDLVSQKLFETELQLNEFKNKYSQMEKLKDMEIEQQKQQQEQRRKSLLNREIRELTLKFQADKAALVAENQKLTNIIDLRGQEIDELTQNLEQLDSTMNNNSSINMKSFEMEQKITSMKKELELSNYNLSIKTQQNDQYRNQIRDLEFKLSQFENSNGDMLRQKESQLMEMSLKCSNQQKKLDEYRNMDQIIQDLNKNNEFLVQENNNLNNQLLEKHQSLEILQINHGNAQQELNKMEAASVHQRDRLNFLASESDKLNHFLQKEKDAHQQSQLKLQQYEQDKQLIGQKEKDLNQQINWLQSEYQSHKQMVYEGQQQMGNQQLKIQDLENQNVLFQKENEKLNYILTNKQSELDQMYQNQIQLENRLDHLNEVEQQCKEYQTHMDMLAVENERLNSVLIQKIEQMEKINQEKNDLKQFQNRSQELQQLIINLRREIDDNQIRIAQLQEKSMQMEQLENQYNLQQQEKQKLEQFLYLKQQEIDNQQQNLQQLNSEYYELKEQVQSIPFLSEEIERLLQVSQEKDEELQQYKQKFIEHNSLCNKIKEYHGLMILLFAEIESLRQRVSEKEAEMNNLRRSTIQQLIKK